MFFFFLNSFLEFNICYLSSNFCIFYKIINRQKNFTTHVVIMCQRSCALCVVWRENVDGKFSNQKSATIWRQMPIDCRRNRNHSFIYRFWLIQFREIWEEKNYSLKDNERSSTLVSFWLLCLKLRRKIALLAIKLVLFGLL